MDPVAETAALVAYGDRAAGTDAERRAANHLAGRVRELGREASIEAIDIRPRAGLLHTAHVLLAVVGGVVAVRAPALGCALVLVALLSTAIDATGALGRPARRLTPRRASQNVDSVDPTDKPGTVVLVAHYDAPNVAPAYALATRRLRDPLLATAAAMAIVLACCLVRLGGVDSTALTAVQFVPTVLLIMLVLAFADLELSGPGEDDADNAAGVATALALAQRLGGRLEHFDVRLVLTGAGGPFALGMAAWLRAHRRELDPRRTAVLSIDGVGDGPLRFASRQGPLLARSSHPDLLRLCREIAEDDGPEGAYAAGEAVVRGPSDAAVARARGFPALTVSCTGGESSAAGLQRAIGFAAELLERLDAEVGPRLRADASASAPQASLAETG